MEGVGEREGRGEREREGGMAWTRQSSGGNRRPWSIESSRSIVLPVAILVPAQNERKYCSLPAECTRSRFLNNLLCDLIDLYSDASSGCI